MGLTSNIRMTYLFSDLHWLRFYPRCYDLSREMEDFTLGFAYVKA